YAVVSSPAVAPLSNGCARNALLHCACSGQRRPVLTDNTCMRACCFARAAKESPTMTFKTIYIPAGGGFDHVSIETSQPTEPAPGEITVRLRASSLNFHDYMVVKGITGPTERRIPMSDGAGEVIAVGEGVSGFSVGDHVVSTFFPDWLDG